MSEVARVHFMCDVDVAVGVEMGWKFGALVVEVGLGREDWLLGWCVRLGEEGGVDTDDRELDCDLVSRCPSLGRARDYRRPTKA